MNMNIANEIKKQRRLQAARDAAGLVAWRKLLKDFDQVHTGSGCWSIGEPDDPNSQDDLCYTREEYDEHGSITSSRSGGFIGCKKDEAKLVMSQLMAETLGIRTVDGLLPTYTLSEAEVGELKTVLLARTIQIGIAADRKARK